MVSGVDLTGLHGEFGWFLGGVGQGICLISRVNLIEFDWLPGGICLVSGDWTRELFLVSRGNLPSFNGPLGGICPVSMGRLQRGWRQLEHSRGDCFLAEVFVTLASLSRKQRIFEGRLKHGTESESMFLCAPDAGQGSWFAASPAYSCLFGFLCVCVCCSRRTKQ